LGAKTGLLVYADGDVPRRLGQGGEADLGRTTAMMRRLYPGWVISSRLYTRYRSPPSLTFGLTAQRW
jgi:hypothetical protein